MTDENAPDAGADTTDAALLESLGGTAERSLHALTDVGAADVFGDPVTVGDRVVVTAAAVTRGGGFGVGSGRGQDESGETGGGGGGGGGGGSEGRPVAVIEITPTGTTVRPVIDFTRLGLTVLTGVLGLWRAGRRRRRA